MKNFVKELRMKNGLTQEDLAKKVGVSRQSIISIEKKKYDPSLPLALKLSKILGERVEKIFILEEDNF